MKNIKLIEVAKITITVSRRRKHQLLPGWEYGTQITAESSRGENLTPKDRRTVEEMCVRVRKAL